MSQENYLQTRRRLKLSRRKKKKPKYLRRSSSKRSEQLKKWPSVRNRFLIEHPYCEWPECMERSVDAHHTEGRTGDNLLDKSKLKALCRSHHDKCKSDPKLAEKNGMIVSRITRVNK